MKEKTQAKTRKNMKWYGIWAIALVIVLTLALVGGFIGTLSEPATNTASISTEEKAPVTTENNPATVDELLTLINAERSKVGSAPLTIDARLNQSAQFKADEMKSTGVYQHRNDQGVHGYEYARQAVGNDCLLVSENFTYELGTLTAEEALEWWMNSESHREALLDPKYTSTGFGVNRSVAVEHFCQQ